MTELSRNGRILVAAVVAAACALLLFGRIGSFGIWDPWELGAADVARDLLAGDLEGERTTPMLSAWLVARGFGLFGVHHEWSGRLPIALAAGLGLLVVALGVRRAVDGRAGLIAAVVVGSTPLFLLHARQMMGWAPAMTAGAVVFFAALELASVDDTDPHANRDRGIAAVVLGLGIALAVLAAGFMLGALPALLGVGVAVVARAEAPAAMAPARRGTSVGVVLLAIGGLVVTALAVMANAEGYSSVLGGTPRGGTPPTFEVGLEQIFHGLAPWSALVPVAFGHVLGRERVVPEGDAARSTERRRELLELGAPAWAGFAFAAQALYCARFGQAPFLAPIALGASIAVCLRDLEKTGRGSWAAGLVAFLLAMLVLRDFRAYPVSPADGLALADVVAPEAFEPTRWWAATLLPFALFAFFGLSRESTDKQEGFLRDVGLEGPSWEPKRLWNLGLPIEMVREQAGRGRAYLLWLGFFALLLASVVIYGFLCVVLGDEARPSPIVAAITGPLALVAVILRFALRKRVKSEWLPWATWGGACVLMAVTIAVGVLAIPGLSSLAIRVGRYLFIVPFGLVLAVAGFRTVRFGFHRLRENSLLPMLVAGWAVGAYASLGWSYELSQHFSPREVYDTYNALSPTHEPLGEYRVSGRAAAYYTEGETREIENEAAALDFLASESRVWLTLRTDDLAALDRAWRTRSGHHLFVADARSARVLLATNQPVAARADENFLAAAILDEAPTPEFPVHANFDNRIELIGYDVEMPGDDRVGPGQRFTVTWYWRCIAPVPGAYTIFLHGDGMGQRLNGDHEPVNGRYPVRLWSEGDIIVDEQELTVPANFPPGTYSYMIGFYSGESRLEVVEGPEDDANRAIAGTFEVR